MKILVVDDEAPARAYLTKLVGALDEPYQWAGEAANGEEAVEFCRRQPVDLVLMDIQMPGMDGLEAARRIGELELPPAVIFTTAHAEHALPAFEVNGAGYLLKPIRPEKLRQALERVQRLTRPQLQGDTPLPQPSIQVRYRGNLQRIPLSAIHYFKAESKYVVVRHQGGEALIEDSLKKLESRFGDRLLRVHRSALVVAERLMGLERRPDGGMAVVLAGIDDRIEVSRRHLPQVRRVLKSLG